MNADAYAQRIAMETRKAVSQGADRRSVGYLEAMARERVMTAGREYQASEDVQGFEDRPPTELVVEIEDELADALAWAVAFRLRMEAAGIDVPVSRFIATIAEAREDMAGWWTDARTAEETE